jgi:hypothetical protein
MPESQPERGYPIVAPRGSSAAEASRPDTTLDERFHIYDSNPVPWWLTIIWLGYLVFGVTYLIINLLQ